MDTRHAGQGGGLFHANLLAHTSEWSDFFEGPAGGETGDAGGGSTGYLSSNDNSSGHTVLAPATVARVAAAGGGGLQVDLRYLLRGTCMP